MNNIIALLVLIQTGFCLYDTVLVGNTTYLYLRIGQFKKISLPFNFTTYYSVDTGKPDRANMNSRLSSVCSVEERQFDLSELDFLLISSKNMGYKDVVTQYDTLLQKRFLVDMAVADNLLYLVYADSIKVVTMNITNNSLGNVSKSFDIPVNITTGKLIKASNTTLYFVGPNVIYSISKSQVSKLQGYIGFEDFESAVMKDEKTILIASRRNGIMIYQLRESTVNSFTVLPNSFFGTQVDIADIQTDDQKKMVYILNRQGTIISLDLNLQNPLQSKIHTYQISRSGCQNMEYFNNQFYVTCPQLHRLTLIGDTALDKTFENPNFNPKNIVFFNSIVIVVGHNLAKIYNDGVEMGYYHDFLMRKLIPLDGKIIIGSDYGVSLTNWNVSELEITCGLKRKGTTERYEGKVSTTIDVVAQCNQQYFRQNNITYKQQLKNDICLYHFPISIDFWIGKEINYLPFKIGVGVILLVCAGVLIAWFILNSKVKNLTHAIRHYSALAPTTSKAPYQNMVEEDGTEQGNDKTSPHSNNAEKQLHDIGD